MIDKASFLNELLLMKNYHKNKIDELDIHDKNVKKGANNAVEQLVNAGALSVIEILINKINGMHSLNIDKNLH